jgi:hypothetical protein
VSSGARFGASRASEGEKDGVLVSEEEDGSFDMMVLQSRGPWGLQERKRPAPKSGAGLRIANGFSRYALPTAPFRSLLACLEQPHVRLERRAPTRAARACASQGVECMQERIWKPHAASTLQKVKRACDGGVCIDGRRLPRFTR